MTIKNICYIASSYVGEPTMAVIAKQFSHVKVTIVNIIKAGISAWNNKNLGKLPAFESGLDSILGEGGRRHLFFNQC